jgi:hypothetical protein
MAWTVVARLRPLGYAVAGSVRNCVVCQPGLPGSGFALWAAPGRAPFETQLLWGLYRRRVRLRLWLRRDRLRPKLRCQRPGLPGRSYRPATGVDGDARLRSELRRGRLRSQPRVENEAWWNRSGSITPKGSYCGSCHGGRRGWVVGLEPPDHLGGRPRPPGPRATDDLLNAIRQAVVDPVRRCPIRVETVHT